MSKKNTKANETTEEERRVIQLKQMKKKDPSILKNQIFTLKEQLSQMVELKNGLEAEIDANQQIYMNETSKIEQNLKSQEEILSQIENQFNSKTKTKEQELLKLKIAQEEARDMSQIKKNKQLDQILAEEAILTKRVDHLQSFPQRQKRYQKSLNELYERHEKMEKQQQKDLGNIKNQHQKTRDKLDKDTQLQMEKIKETEVVRLEKKLTREQFIKKENDVLEKQIQLCHHHKEFLQRECTELNGQVATSKSNQGNSVLGTQANQTYQRSLRIIKLEGKLNKLKTYLNEQTTRLQKEYNDLDGIYNRQFQDLEAKNSKIEGWIRMKERDLKKVKACSQMVLNQRNNLESYLLEVFYEHPELDYKDERNINKILRFLFAKINSRKPPTHYKDFTQSNQNSLASSSYRA